LTQWRNNLTPCFAFWSPVSGGNAKQSSRRRTVTKPYRRYGRVTDRNDRNVTDRTDRDVTPVTLFIRRSGSACGASEWPHAANGAWRRPPRCIGRACSCRSLLPLGAPLPSAPPRIRHLRRPVTGADLHGAPDLVLAPQRLSPDANGGHCQGRRPAFDEIGQGLLHFYKPPSLRERLESRADAPLRPSRGQKPLPKSGLFGS
jgi:hypothetical protein